MPEGGRPLEFRRKCLSAKAPSGLGFEAIIEKIVANAIRSIDPIVIRKSAPLLNALGLKGWK